MLRSRLRRANEPLVLAFGHSAEGGTLSCDVLLINAHTQAPDIDLEDVTTGAITRVRLPADALGQHELSTHYGVTLEVRP